MSFFSPPKSSTSRRIYSLAVVLLLLVFATELSMSVRQLSQTADEAAHLYSGYQYWKARDFGLNPEHPPLLKLVAALPLLALPLEQPHPPTFRSKIEEYVGGGQFLYRNDADMLLLRGRLAASIFSLLLALLIFATAFEMFGRGAAMLALILCVFEPNLLAHGALITTDMVAALTSLACVYAFYRYVKHPGPVRLILAGLAMGLALAAKFSGVVMAPVLALLVLTEWWLQTRKPQDDRNQPLDKPIVARGTTGSGARKLLSLCAALAGVLAIAFVVLWAFYTFRYSARPGNSPLAPTLEIYAQELVKPLEKSLILGLARGHILPESYLYGLTDLEAFAAGRPSFLLGTLYPGPTRLYFPIALLIKNTLPILLLLVALPFLLLSTKPPAIGRRRLRELFFVLVPPVVFLLVSLNAPLNIGVRHVLPIFPFVTLLAAFAASMLAARSRAGAILVAVLVVFHIASSARTFPDYLAYSNEAFGGKARTYRVLSDSNADWGQGIKEVAFYLRKNDVKDCWFAPFMSQTQYYHIPCRPLPTGFGWVVGMPMPVVPAFINGTLLISASEASGLFWGPPALNPYSRFETLPPDDVIGGSVLVFHGNFDLPLAAALAHSSQVRPLMQQGKMPEALAEAQAAVALAPDSPAAQMMLGTVLEKMGRRAEGDQALQLAADRARVQNPGDMMQLNKSIKALREER